MIPDYTFLHEFAYNDWQRLRRVRHHAHAGTYLLKTPRAVQPSAADLELLAREYALLKELEFPGVPGVLDLVQREQQAWLLLADEGVESWPFSAACGLQEFFDLALQLTALLAELHRREITHNQLRPCALLRQPSTGALTLADFSLAARVTENPPQVVRCTVSAPPALAPQPLCNPGAASAYRADLSALGALFYELLTGHVPTAADLQPTHLSATLPAPLASVVLKLLTPNAPDGYQSALEAQAALESCARAWATAQGVEPFPLGRAAIEQANARQFAALGQAIERQHQAEEILRVSEEFKTRLIEGSQDCIKVLDLAGRLLSMNAGGMQVLDICDFAPLCGSAWLDFWQGEFRAAASAALATAGAGGTGRFVGFCPTMNGTPKWWDVAVTPILDADGQPEKLLAVSRDVTAQKQATQTLRSIVTGTAAVTGGDFFRSMVKHLASALPVKLAFVTECANVNKTRARMLAFWDGQQVVDGLEYDVKDTTCEFVYQGQPCYYPANLQQLFPKEEALVELDGQSYIGLPLCSQSGELIGHLAVIDDQPLTETRGAQMQDVLQIFAARASVELERTKAEAELRQAMAEIETLKNQLHAENVYLQEEIRHEHNFDEIIGSSPALLTVLQQIELAAPTDATVLILGETGTGKELIARAIHNRSPRRERPLVKVNCGAISAGLVESELFGHVKGAFTGALDKRTGRFELAHGGTLFLDEVGELARDTQVKLLRVLQEGEFEPVGSNRTVNVDVRIIAATNRDLSADVKAGRFRADLYYRLNVLPLHNPALRERREDIAPLAMFFLARYAKRFGKQVHGITQETMEALCDYAWPGNVRELQNLIERGVVLATGPLLSLSRELLPLTTFGAGQPPASATPHAASPGLPAATNATVASNTVSMDEVARQHILAMLEQTGWVIEGAKGAAVLLNLHPNTLRSRMKKLGIKRQSVPN
jgi:formate hydrogenlyase transcriptional activator